MRRILPLLTAIFLSSHTIAQTTVLGTVSDKSTLKPIEFASVVLIHLPDSAVAGGTATDKKGRFVFESVKPGSYSVRSSFVGFSLLETQPFEINSQQAKYVIEPIGLLSDSKTLTSVTVTGTRAQLNTSIDRKTYNVEQDVMSRSGTAADILKNIPSVEVDVDGNVALRGSGDVIILINGKPNPLMGRTRAEVLQQLPANSIERIEVITNPSARYRPDGTSGIINIVLKKNVRNGFNGTATLNAGNKDRYNGALSLNYRPKQFNLFGSYSFRQDTRKRYFTTDRSYFDESTGLLKSSYSQTVNSLAHPHAQIATLGVDYTLNEKNSFGLSGNYFNRTQVRNDVAANKTFGNSGSLTEGYTRFRYDPEKEKQHDAVAYFQHSFGKDEHDLRVEFNSSNEDEVEDNHYTNDYRIPININTYENTRIQQTTRQNQLTADYSNRLSEDAKLEAGYDGLYSRVDLNFYGEVFEPVTQKFVTDLSKTNRFLYNEDVHALYGTYQKSYEKFGYEVGLRTEAVFTTGHLVNLDSTVTNNYFKVYPTIHLSCKLNEASEVQLNYSKRVHRPEADELNPFPEYQDPLNLRAGNPKLLPEVIHSVEAGYKWQNKTFSVVPSIYYRYKVNGFTSVLVPLSNNAVLSTTQNLSNDQSAGLEVILSAKAKFFTSSLSTNFFYNRIDATNLGYVQNKSIYSASANFTSSFTVTKATLLQLSGNYRSARLTPQGKTFPTFVLNTGLRQDLLTNRLSITATASDLFSSLKQKTELNIPSLKQVTVGRRDGLIVYLGFSYRFGIIKKVKDESMQFENAM